MSLRKPTPHKAGESTRISAKKSDTDTANAGMTSVSDPMATQQLLTSNEVVYLQRTIGNTATVKLLAEQRQNGTPANADVTKTKDPTAAAFIQRFPTSALISSQSSADSSQKSGVTGMVKAFKKASTFDQILETVDQYHKDIANYSVGLDKARRRLTYQNIFAPQLHKIDDMAREYISDHKSDVDRTQTVGRFGTLRQEVAQELSHLGSIVEDTKYDTAPGTNQITWANAINAIQRPQGQPDLVVTLLDSLGLPGSFRSVLSEKKAFGNLRWADIALEAGNMPKADAELSVLQTLIPDSFNLVRTALMRKHVRTINPELAKVLDAPTPIKDSPGRSALASQTFKADRAILTLGTNYMKTFFESLKDVDDKTLMKDAKKELQEHKNRQTALDAWYEKRKESSPQGITAANKQYRAPEESVKNYKKRHKWERKFVNKEQFENVSDHGKLTMLNYMSDYGQFNDPLRGNLTPTDKNGQFSEANLAKTHSIISALDELPPYEGNVYRHDRVFPGFDEVRREGAVMTDMAVISATRETSTLKLISGSGAAEVLSVIRSKSGRYAKPLSSYNSRATDENEVIFKPGSRFRILKRYDGNLNNRAYKFPEDMDAELRQALSEDQEKVTIKVILLMEEM